MGHVRRVPQRYVVRIVAEDGQFEIAQAESLSEAREFKAKVAEERPDLKVNYYKSESGLAIFEGWMNEIFR